ncbi:MrcB family domain-containing protein [Neobacillus dielmonensis]|uniref:MrcB family domain-containing protein n=1 Tax=Neobacillus dielmonensis TaxID=1347369 RepID=UPI0005AA5FF4|nr:DUF3578 domain-containing protein [Neobacillus dielmonensis]
MLQVLFEQVLADKAHGINNRLLLKGDIPKRLNYLLAGNSPRTLHIYGSSGQTFESDVPWDAICFKQYTTTTRFHLFCVFLLAKDGSGMYLSLNQGVDYLKGLNSVKKVPSSRRQKHSRYLESCSCELLGKLGDTTGYITGPIDLRINKPTSTGWFYQYSNIAAKYYQAGAIPTEAHLLQDVLDLLDKYDELITSVPNYPSFVYALL